MKAVYIEKPFDLKIVEVPTPEVQNPTDVKIKRFLNVYRFHSRIPPFLLSGFSIIEIAIICQFFFILLTT